MNQVEKNVLTKVSSVLNSLNLKFAIVDSDGNKHGDLDVAQVKKPKRRRSIYPLGELRAHIMPHLTSIMINTTKHIPVGKYQPDIVRGSVSSYATHLWGAGNYKTKVSQDKRYVEVTRMDPAVASFMKHDPVADLLSGWDDGQPQRLTRETFNASS
jgi:hypothetical protein